MIGALIMAQVMQTFLMTLVPINGTRGGQTRIEVQAVDHNAAIAQTKALYQGRYTLNGSERVFPRK